MSNSVVPAVPRASATGRLDQLNDFVIELHDKCLNVTVVGHKVVDTDVGRLSSTVGDIPALSDEGQQRRIMRAKDGLNIDADEFLKKVRHVYAIGRIQLFELLHSVLAKVLLPSLARHPQHRKLMLVRLDGIGKRSAWMFRQVKRAFRLRDDVLETFLYDLFAIKFPCCAKEEDTAACQD